MNEAPNDTVNSAAIEFVERLEVSSTNSEIMTIKHRAKGGSGAVGKAKRGRAQNSANKDIMQHNVHPEQDLVIEDLLVLAQGCGFDLHKLRRNLEGQLKTSSLVDLAHHVHCACPPPNFPAGLIDRITAIIEIRETQSRQAETRRRYQRESEDGHVYFTQTLRQMRESLIGAHPSYWRRVCFAI